MQTSTTLHEEDGSRSTPCFFNASDIGVLMWKEAHGSDRWLKRKDPDALVHGAGLQLAA